MQGVDLLEDRTLKHSGDTCLNHPETPAEWLNLYCQDCWEAYCASCWWALIDGSYPIPPAKKDGDHRPR